MHVTNKVLLIGVYVFLIIILFELVYYNHFLNNNLQPKTLSQKTQEIKFDEADMLNFCTGNLYPPSSPEQALPEGNIKSLRVFKNGVLLSSNHHYTYGGKVIELEEKNLPDGDLIKITVQADTNEKNSFFYPREIFNQVGKEIKIGDLVEISVVYDMLNTKSKTLNIKKLNEISAN